MNSYKGIQGIHIAVQQGMAKEVYAASEPREDKKPL